MHENQLTLFGEAVAGPAARKSAEDASQEAKAVIFFELFRDELAKWHKFQDAPGNTGGNDFNWWQSRWSDWLDYKSSNPTDVWKTKSEKDKAFPLVWKTFEKEFRRYER